MKKILFLVAVIVATSCSKEEELVYIIPGYMTKVYAESTNCSQPEFFTAGGPYLFIGRKSVESLVTEYIYDINETNVAHTYEKLNVLLRA